MAAIISSINFNLRWALSRRNIILWLLVAVLILGYTWGRINDYQLLPSKETTFKEIQQKKFKATSTYENYAHYGVDSLLTPAPTSILFSNTIMPEDVKGQVNSHTYFSLNSNLVNRNTSPDNLLYEMDASGIIFFFLALIALLYGLDVTRNKPYARFVASSFSKRPRTGVAIFLFSRYFVLLSAFIIIYIMQVLLILIRGIALSGTDVSALIGHATSATLLLGVTFSAGAIIGNFKISDFWTAFTIFFTLAIILYGIPSLMFKLTKNTLPDITEADLVSLDNLLIINKFEERSLEEFGRFNRDNIDQEQKIIEEFKRIDFPLIKGNQLSLYEKIKAAAVNHDLLSMLTPGSFYLQTSSEVSSRGYHNFLGFYRMQIELQEGFFHFYIDRTFYNDPKIMVNFIKDDENIYRATAHVPDHFLIGIIANLFWLFLFFGAAIYGATRRLSPKKAIDKEIKEVEISFEKGKHTLIVFPNDGFIFQLMGYFDGSSDSFPCKINLDGKPVTPNNRLDYLFIPNPSNVPGEIKTSTYIGMLNKKRGKSGTDWELLCNGISKKDMGAYLKDVQDETKAVLLLNYALVSRRDIVILSDIGRNLWNTEAIEERVNRLKEQGTVVIDYAAFPGQHFWTTMDNFFIFNLKDKKYQCTYKKEFGELK